MTDDGWRFDAPALLSEAHDHSTFESGDTALDVWLRKCARQNLLMAASRTDVVCSAGSNRIVGYVVVSMGQILGSEVAGAMRHTMPKQIPAVILRRLAIDRAWQGFGLGAALLADVVGRAVRAAQDISARLVIVHAISPAAEEFYLHHGFGRLPVPTPTLALDLLKLQTAIR